MKKVYLARLLALLLVAGCWVQLPQLPPPLGPTPTPTIGLLTQRAQMDNPGVCTDLPEGMEMSVTPLSATVVRVDLQGMLPGEQLNFIYVAQSTSEHERRFSDWPYDRVKEDGTFSLRVDGLKPADGNTSNIWIIKVVHARGVACQEITLAMP